MLEFHMLVFYIILPEENQLSGLFRCRYNLCCLHAIINYLPAYFTHLSIFPIIVPTLNRWIK